MPNGNKFGVLVVPEFIRLTNLQTLGCTHLTHMFFSTNAGEELGEEIMAWIICSLVLYTLLYCLIHYFFLVCLCISFFHLLFFCFLKFSIWLFFSYVSLWLFFTISKIYIKFNNYTRRDKRIALWVTSNKQTIQFIQTSFNLKQTNS